ncbi:hypothetical protein IFM89_038696 [Coptis chinensis]|uniref:Uncharacterized protein n=1 Tax=Coptis chinensis TaxID=261450 RepID=A0A835H200_9MAGN|nr:hypothetical protein IFM89_038696 [Coptis chinensis]
MESFRAFVTAAFLVGLLFSVCNGLPYPIEAQSSTVISGSDTLSDSHRKLLGRGELIAGRYRSCSIADMLLKEVQVQPLPNGIPQYLVQITNLCPTPRCAISNILVKCDEFSSDRTINPKMFRRLRHNHCLVNDGMTLKGGATISFQYANSFSSKLSVLKVLTKCI